MAKEARPGLLRKEHAERLAAQQLAAVVEQQLRRPVHLLDDSQGVGHDVPAGCELEELLVAPALVFQRQLRGQELLVLLAQLLLGEAQGLDRALQLLTGVLARDLRRRFSPVRLAGELLSALAQGLELLGEGVPKYPFGSLHRRLLDGRLARANAQLTAPARTRSTTSCAATEPGPACAPRMPRSCSMRRGLPSTATAPSSLARVCSTPSGAPLMMTQGMSQRRRRRISRTSLPEKTGRPAATTRTRAPRRPCTQVISELARRRRSAPLAASSTSWPSARSALAMAVRSSTSGSASKMRVWTLMSLLRRRGLAPHRRLPSPSARSAALALLLDLRRAERRQQASLRALHAAADTVGVEPHGLADPLEGEAPGAIAAVEPAPGLSAQVQVAPPRSHHAVDLDRVLQDRQRETVLAAEPVG